MNPLPLIYQKYLYYFYFVQLWGKSKDANVMITNIDEFYVPTFDEISPFEPVNCVTIVFNVLWL